jgi:hypothetical protein
MLPRDIGDDVGYLRRRRSPLWPRPSFEERMKPDATPPEPKPDAPPPEPNPFDSNPFDSNPFDTNPFDTPAAPAAAEAGARSSGPLRRISFGAHWWARLRRIATAGAWLGVALLLALGGAGIVSATSRPPVAGARPELTWAADRALEPELVGATADLARLSDEVDALGEIGRTALTTVVDRDTDGLRKAIADGEAQLKTIKDATETLRGRLDAIPGIGPDDPTRIGTSLRIRYDRLVAALKATDGLSDSWSALTRGSLAAIELTTTLAQHDLQTAEAAKLGRKFQYKQALTILDKADAALDRSRLLRDRLANTTDVAILTQWIDRNAAFDTSVRKVWTALIRSKGKINKTVRNGFDELRTAQAALPPDSRAMVVIMSDVARGTMNGAVIAIEQARGRLSAAADALGGG